MNVHYRVELSNEERAVLEELVYRGSPRVRKVKRALILLAADRGDGQAEIGCCRASWLMGDGIGFLMAIKEVRDSRPADDGRGQSGGARGDRGDRRPWAAACGWTGKQAAFRQRPALQTAGGG